MKLLIILCLSLLPSLPLMAQRTIVGRVTDRATGAGIPGVTVVQRRSDNLTTTTSDGTFSLKCPPVDTAGVALVFSAIGYLTVERLVADSIRVTLSRGIICYSIPRASLAFVSGVLHTPFGAMAQLYGPRFTRLPLAATVVCQTDFRRNHQTLFQFDWLELIHNEWIDLTAGLRRATFQNGRQQLSVTLHNSSQPDH